MNQKARLLLVGRLPVRGKNATKLLGKWWCKRSRSVKGREPTMLRLLKHDYEERYHLQCKEYEASDHCLQTWLLPWICDLQVCDLTLMPPSSHSYTGKS